MLQDRVRRSYARDASGSRWCPKVVARPASIAHVVVKEARTRELTDYAAARKLSTGMGLCLLHRRGVVIDAGDDVILDIDAAGRVARVEPGASPDCALNEEWLSPRLALRAGPTSETMLGRSAGPSRATCSGARSLRYGATRPHSGAA